MERLTNIQGLLHECIDCIENDNCYEHSCNKINDAIKKLSEYEDLEERLEKIFNGELPLKVYVDLLERHVSDRERTDQLIARMLTYEDAEEWDEYKRLRDSGLLLRLPCRGCGRMGRKGWRYCLLH